MPTNVNITYIINLSRLDWLEHIENLYTKLELFRERGDEKNVDRIFDCLHYAEEELDKRLTDE